jgi:hypothetical protein
LEKNTVGTTYTKTDDLLPLIRRLRAANHRDLDEASVMITVLMATNSDAPALTSAGWPAQALIKIVSLKDRVAGMDDAVMYIDAENWDKLNKMQQEALVDHELLHLDVRRDKEGVIRYDDCGRPKLKMRPHDWQFGGFNTIARRHGVASQERAFLERLQTMIQAELPFEQTDA